MELGPLTLFTGLRCNHEPRPGVLIAAWHWPWSITWRWSLTRSPWLPRKRYPVWFHRTCRYQPGLHFVAGFNLPVVGYVTLILQPNCDTREGARKVRV